MGRSNASIFNLISILFLLLSCGVIILVTVRLAGPPDVVEQAVVLPTQLVLPSPTNTPTHTPSLTPSRTPSATPTETPSLTPTDAPTTFPTFTPSQTFTVPPSATITPSLTITATLTPSLTPQFTNTPVETPTLAVLITQAPLPATPSPFPFDLQGGQVIYTVNTYNAAGCAWQGVGGQIFDINGQPLPGFRVHVFGGGFDQTFISGANTLYGPSGWEATLGTGVSASTYTVEVLSPEGTLISPQVSVQFQADCNRNLALVNFQQTRPF